MNGFVELLAGYEPARAERVRAELAGPPPDTVLVLGPDDALAGQVVAALAARLPPAVRCVPLAAQGEPRSGGVGAVVWVNGAGGPPTERRLAALRELARRVDRIHLLLSGTGGTGALSGTARIAGGAGTGGTDPAGVARAVPRLAGQVVFRWPGELGGLVDAVWPVAELGRRNGLRTVRTELGELLDRRLSRRRHADQRRAATERALRERRAELTAYRLELVADWPRQVRADLARARLGASDRAAEALRGLRDDARAWLARADQAGRRQFPARLAGAAAALTAELIAELTARLDAALDEIEPDGPPARPEPAGPGSPVLEPREPPALPGGRIERWLGPVVGASGGLAVGRLALVWLNGVSGALGAAATPVAAGIGVSAGFWLMLGRRAAVDRIRLTRWTAESLADLRVRLESVLAERVLTAERRSAARIDRIVAARAAELDLALRENELLTRRLELGTAAPGTDPAALVELRGACVELDQRLAPGAPGPGPAR